MRLLPRPRVYDGNGALPDRLKRRHAKTGGPDSRGGRPLPRRRDGRAAAPRRPVGLIFPLAAAPVFRPPSHGFHSGAQTIYRRQFEV